MTRGLGQGTGPGLGAPNPNDIGTPAGIGTPDGIGTPAGIGLPLHDRPAILVTGGAGYIGSHACVSLVEAGYRPVILDNFSNSSRMAVDRVREVAGAAGAAAAGASGTGGAVAVAGAAGAPLTADALPLIEGDVRDVALVTRVLEAYRVRGVIHFAALKAVGESVAQPLRYFSNNIGGTLALLEAMSAAGVGRLVFSSSCTVYGDPGRVPVDESAPLSAANPYGRSKLVMEEVIGELCRVDPRFSSVLLRYFNPVGAHPSGRLGEDPRGTPQNLLPYAVQVAGGRRPRLKVFGGDWPTPDGTGIRDYIHVMDLVEAHVAALRHLETGMSGGEVIPINLGTGEGASVLEVVRALEVASGRSIPHEIVARRPGDVARVWADPTRARTLLGWTASRSLAEMCTDAWRWQQMNPEGYDGARCVEPATEGGSMTRDGMDELRIRAEVWTRAPFDAETRAQVAHLLAEDPDGLHEAFYRDIDFGTGGMRGIMGVGTNRINRYTLGQASEGLARYVKRAAGPGHAPGHAPEHAPAHAPAHAPSPAPAHAPSPAPAHGPFRIAIAHDTRHNSEALTAAVAGVFVAHGFEVCLFDGFMPTPLLSFAVRELGCHAGIVLTASHNPPAYNGYKVYWSDGAQVVPPHDRGIIEEVRGVGYDEIRFGDASDDGGGGDGGDGGRPEGEGQGGAAGGGGGHGGGRIIRIGEDLFQAYFARLRGIRIHPDLLEAQDLKMVFTPLHGTTVHLLPRALEACGFPRPQLVEAQAIPSGDFPTVKSPNPEEPEALEAAVALAEAAGADLVLGCDPDGDRIGIAVPLPGAPSHRMVLLNGNQTASLMVDYLIRERVEAGTLPERAFVCSTVVTSTLLCDIAAHYGVACYESLTGFKWIAERIRQREGEGVFLGGGEESYGFMVGDFVRDKDGIGSAVLLAEAAARARATGGLYAQLLRLYARFGYYHEQMHALTLEGAAGATRIEAMMRGYRSDPPALLMGERVTQVKDFDALEMLDVVTGARETFAFERSNVLQFFTDAGSRITVRPSGTEPKIKFYVSLREAVAPGVALTPADLEALEARGRVRVAQCLEALGV